VTDQSLGELPGGNRHVECEGAFNIRDIGGYPTTDGRTTRWGVLYRADGLYRVPDAAIAGLARLGWRTVMDLRTPNELERHGTYRGADVDVVHLPMMRDTSGWSRELLEQHDDPSDFLADRYLDMTEQGAASIARAFALIASPDSLPAVFHCAAGKDRTGVLAAVILGTLGVPDEHVSSDYGLTAPAMDRLVEWMSLNQPDWIERMADQPPVFMRCPPTAMEKFLVLLREKHGSMDGFLAHLGVPRSTVEGARATLLD
jgi:protein-tyrosine phosphatase